MATHTGSRDNGKGRCPGLKRLLADEFGGTIVYVALAMPIFIGAAGLAVDVGSWYAVYPSTRGFGYAVFDGPEILVDWGVRSIRGARKNPRSLKKIQDLLALYPPDALVLEDYRGEGSRRSRRIEKLTDAAAELAAKGRIPVATFSRGEVRTAFAEAGAATKAEIAHAIADEFPELEPRLPPVRKLWMSEDVRMNIFDAVALGMTFFHTKESAKRAA
jgi:Holliday junction resolvasome RuvABC endonuclease subunit